MAHPSCANRNRLTGSLESPEGKTLPQPFPRLLECKHCTSQHSLRLFFYCTGTNFFKAESSLLPMTSVTPILPLNLEHTIDNAGAGVECKWLAMVHCLGGIHKWDIVSRGVTVSRKYALSQAQHMVSVILTLQITYQSVHPTFLDNSPSPTSGQVSASNALSVERRSCGCSVRQQ